MALRSLGLLDEALASYDRAISLKPDYAAADYNRGNVLQDLERFDEALASYDRAIAIKPDHAEASSPGMRHGQLHFVHSTPGVTYASIDDKSNHA